MKINKLRIKNMYGVKGDVEYDLSPRIVGLFGKNGAGKSSVINSLKLAIGGEKTSSAMLRGVDNSAVRLFCCQWHRPMELTPSTLVPSCW